MEGVIATFNIGATNGGIQKKQQQFFEDCPLRPAAELQELMDNSGGSLDMLRPQCEMNPDDMEIGGVSTEEADAGEDLAEDDADDEDELTHGTSWWTWPL